MKNNNAFTWTELIVVIVIIAVLTAILFPAIKAARTGTGDTQLRKKPDETNRVYHSNGMSIIRPSDWVQEEPYDSPNRQRLMFWAGALRYPCSISITSEDIKKTPEETIDDNSIPLQIRNMCNTGHFPNFKEYSFEKTLFQNEPAFKFVEREHHSGSWQDPSFLRGGICFFRANKCYLLEYRYFFHSKKIEVPENLRLYLESFRPPEADISEKPANEN
jgi:prepilin-type N-terminal cleavage/methylation domain-containing protein